MSKSAAFPGSEDTIAKTSLSTQGRFLYALFFSLAALGLATRYNILALPLLSDNQHYFYMAERFASGISPYTSHFEPKQALSMMLTGMAIRAGRFTGVSDLFAARILSISIFSISVGLIWLLTYRLTQSTRTSALAALSMLSFSGYVYQGAMGCRPKMFLVFFIVLSMLFFCMKKMFWAGLCASLSFLCWQPALLVLAALMFVLLLSSDRLRYILKAASGAVIAIIIYESYFIFTGTFWEQIEQTCYFPFMFMSNNFSGFVSSFVELWTIWTWSFRSFNFLLIVFAYGLIRYWIYIYRKKGSRFFLYDMEAGWIYFHICMFGSLAFIYYDHQGYPDMFFILPFVAIISGWTFDRSIKDVSRFAPNLKGGFQHLAFGLCLFVLLVMIIAGTYHFEPDFTLSDQYRLAAEVRQFLDENERVYAIGCTHLLAFNHSENWMIYGFFFRNIDDFILHKTGADKFRPVKNNIWPSIILLTRRGPRGRIEWQDALYEKRTPPAFERQKIKVFKLKQDVSQGIVAKHRKCLPMEGSQWSEDRIKSALYGRKPEIPDMLVDMEALQN